ncbi:unnamed protein product, partial [Ectocarpus sp. 8 AP-2014]
MISCHRWHACTTHLFFQPDNFTCLHVLCVKRIDTNTTCQCASCTYHLPSDGFRKIIIIISLTSIHTLGSPSHSSLIACVGFWRKHENTDNQNAHDEHSARYAYHASKFTHACLGRTRCCCCLLQPETDALLPSDRYICCKIPAVYG